MDRHAGTVVEEGEVQHVNYGPEGDVGHVDDIGDKLYELCIYEAKEHVDWLDLEER